MNYLQKLPKVINGFSDVPKGKEFPLKCVGSQESLLSHDSGICGPFQAANRTVDCLQKLPKARNPFQEAS